MGSGSARGWARQVRSHTLMAAAPDGALPPQRAIALLLFACALAVGPLWSPSYALLLSDLVGYFPSLFAMLPAMWDPMVQGGTPLLPNPQAGFFYPPAWLLRGDLQAGLPWFLFLHFAIGALATWAWVRTRFGDGWEAVLAGVVFALSGPTFSLALTPDKLPGHVLLPALLLGLHWWLAEHRSARRVLGLTVAAGSVAGMWLAGSIESVFMAAMAAPLWATFLPGADPSLRGRRLGSALGVLALGTGLASVLLVPFFTLLPETARAGALPLAEAMQRATHPVDWLGWVSPNPFWQGDELAYRISGDATRARWLRSLYGGALVLALWPALSRRVPGVALAAVGCLAFAVLALGDLNPLAALVHATPGLGSVRYPDKWWLGTVPLQAWLAASALARVLQDPRAARRAAALTGVLALVALGGLALSYGGGSMQRAAVRLGASALPLVVSCALLVRWSRGKAGFAWVFVLLVAADLLGANLRAMPWSDARAHRERPPAVAAIRADQARTPSPQPRGPVRLWDDSLHVANRLPPAPPGEAFLAMERAVLAPNIATEHGVAYIDGMRALRMARQASFSAVLEDLPPTSRRRLLRRAGVEYWLVWGFDEGADLARAAGLRPVPAAPGVPLDVALLAEPRPLPRVRQVVRWQRFEGDAAAYRFLQTSDDPGMAALITGDPGVATIPAPPQAATPPAPLVWRSGGPGRWEARWDSGSASLLVVQEVWAPGWRYAIDGGAWTPAARVDHMLIGVPLPAGGGSVVLRYRPAGLDLGAGLTALSLLVLLGWRRRLS